MTLPESGMPDRSYWESLFNPAYFLERLGFDETLGDVADFGCGYGTFALALAERAAGTVYAIDVDPAMLRLTDGRARAQELPNVVPVECDLLARGSSLTAESVDAVLIAHLLHGEDEENVALLEEAHRVLRPGGHLGIVHWRRDVETPRGPPLGMRLSPEACRLTCAAAGFDVDPAEIPHLGPYHWGITARKPS